MIGIWTEKSRRTRGFRRVLAAVAAAMACAGASARDDQTWINFSLDYAICNGWGVHFDQELEFGNSQMLDEESVLLATYEFCPAFSVAFGHKILRERSDSRGPLLTEHRPTFDLCFAAPEFWTLKFDFRSRFEYRDLKRTQPYMRYRERFRLRTSWSATDFKFSPFASMEFLFSDKPGVNDSDLLNSTRSQVGVSFHPVPSNPALEFGLYFMVLHSIDNGASDWDPMNIYGFDVSYSF